MEEVQKATNVTWHEHKINRIDREKILNHINK